MDIRLGMTIAFGVDAGNFLDPHGKYELRGRVIAVCRHNRDNYLLGWRDDDKTPEERVTSFHCGDEFTRVSNFDDYDYYLSSKSIRFAAREIKKDEDIMAKVLGDVKQDAVDAAWRQGVEKVIESGHKHLVTRATATLGSARGKLVASFLESNVGRHVLAYGLGVALETAVPHVEDERLERLAKELRVYGLEVVMGFFVTEVQGFLKDALKHLPKKVPATLPAT